MAGGLTTPKLIQSRGLGGVLRSGAIDAGNGLFDSLIRMEAKWSQTARSKGRSYITAPYNLRTTTVGALRSPESSAPRVGDNEQSSSTETPPAAAIVTCAYS